MNPREVSKQMAYLLRHDPSGLEMNDEGFVDLEELLARLKERWKNLNDPRLREIVEQDPKGRYEISGDRIRALYGHSIDVEPDLPEVDVQVLYHGTSEKSAERINQEGLKSQGRRKVHLSAKKKDAIEVGERHTPDPVLLEINAEKAIEAGIVFQKASEKVYVTDFVPPEFIEKSED